MKLIGIAATAAVLLAWGTTSIFAHGWGGANSETLIQRLVEKFGLKTADVQAVFDTVRSEHQAQMQKDMAERYDELVQEGKLTEAQKNLITAKLEELNAQREAEKDTWKDLTPEERRAKMEARRTELETWAQQHNIPLQYVLGFGRGEGMGMGKWFMQH